MNPEPPVTATFIVHPCGDELGDAFDDVAGVVRGHARAHGRADLAASSALGAGVVAARELLEDRLGVQREFVDLAAHADFEALAQSLLERRAVDAVGQVGDELVEVALVDVAGRTGA